jgi:phospholipase A-2-activating protein
MIQSKILQFNEQAGDLAMNEKELSDLSTIIKTLGETSRYHASSFNDSQYLLLLKLLKWPENLVFPSEKFLISDRLN